MNAKEMLATAVAAANSKNAVGLERQGIRVFHLQGFALFMSHIGKFREELFIPYDSITGAVISSKAPIFMTLRLSDGRSYSINGENDTVQRITGVLMPLGKTLEEEQI